MILRPNQCIDDPQDLINVLMIVKPNQCIDDPETLGGYFRWDFRRRL